jgi:orotate phosphoribosyltransferase
VTSALVVVDREQGGSHSLSEKGVAMNSLCTLSKVKHVHTHMCTQKHVLCHRIRGSEFRIQ